MCLFPMNSAILLLVLSIASLGVFSSPAFARLGESESDVEERLIRSRLGRVYEGKILEKKRGRLKALHPLVSAIRQVRGDEELNSVLMFKSADGEKISSSDWSSHGMWNSGWDFEYLVVENRVVAEAYYRVGAEISVFEFNGLMALNNRGQTWLKRDELSEADLERFGLAELQVSMPVEFVLPDGSAAGARIGNAGLVFFELGFLRKLDEARQRAREKEAPHSLRGF